MTECGVGCCQTSEEVYYMRVEYDNLCSKIQDSETRITKELRDKADQQAREDSTTMDETYSSHGM
jgi:hypothetical protein